MKIQPLDPIPNLKHNNFLPTFQLKLLVNLKTTDRVDIIFSKACVIQKLEKTRFFLFASAKYSES